MAFEEKTEVNQETNNLSEELKLAKEENENLKKVIEEHNNNKMTIEDYKAEKEKFLLKQQQEELKQKELEEFSKAYNFVESFDSIGADDATKSIINGIKGKSKTSHLDKELGIKKVYLDYFFDKNKQKLEEIVPANKNQIISFLNSKDVDRETVNSLWDVHTNIKAYLKKEEQIINQQMFANGHYSNDNILNMWSAGKGSKL